MSETANGVGQGGAGGDAPERVWLDPEAFPAGMALIATREIQWEGDVEYVRADLASSPRVLIAAASKVALWMEQQATRYARQAETSRDFPSLADACRGDAANYRKMAADLRAAIASTTPQRGDEDR
jgi:hypothetical protein